MTRYRILLSVAACLLLGACATGGGAPPPASMPAARAALRPEYRIFYDALTDYGDWVLVEPHGFVFRPVDFLWRPYEYGFWAPTDAYGWVWISSEPFGWATYHYGQWYYDSYQGWVWQPGLDWGPAWVSWQIGDDWVGWSPLLDDGSGAPPDGGYIWAPIQQLGSADIRLSLKKAQDLGGAATTARRVDNTVVRDGVRIQLGPSLGRVERALGMPLTRVRVEDIVPVDGASSPSTPDGGIDETRRAAEEAAREAKVLSERGGRLPSRLPVVRPLGVPAPAGPAPGVGRKLKPGSGARDTAATKR